MKFYFFIIAALYGSLVSAQGNSYVIDMDGIGEVKIGMSQEDLEKVIHKKIPLTNPTDTISGSWMDSATVVYKSIPLFISFQRSYSDSVHFNMTISGISTKNKLVKTIKGIGIGSNKIAVINAYEFNAMDIFPEYNEDGKLSGNSLIYVYDDAQKGSLRFLLTKNKVVSIESTIGFDEED